MKHEKTKVFTVLELDTPTLLNRIYPRSEIENAINYPITKARLDNNTLFVELLHDDIDSEINLEYVIGIIKRLFIEDNYLKVEYEPLPDNKHFKEIGKITTAGTGNVSEDGVVSDYMLLKFIGE